ncbi:MAG: WecB/TagA/CpsF family glycosyltransferase [Bacteroidales bacterium]|nr:WecB/TagA/CpsF family glycosyltransferase [Bacteroidales bacterium]
MEEFFNIPMEFDQDRFDVVVEQTVRGGGKGYVCAAESNNITVANTDPAFLQVFRSSLLNNCDGSVVALFLSRIHHRPLQSYICADIFSKYIRCGKYRHFFLGNSPEIIAGLRQRLTEEIPALEGMRFEPLPYCKVGEFDYRGIADMINADRPDIVWVSLGAPKQELFMSRLLPLLERGVLFGVGAVFNFYSGVGKVRRAPLWMRRLRLEWLHRAFEEPSKNIPRYWGFIRILPSLIRQERKKLLSLRR